MNLLCKNGHFYPFMALETCHFRGSQQVNIFLEKGHFERNVLFCFSKFKNLKHHLYGYKASFTGGDFGMGCLYK